jgi:glycosyltransferase involved in cell wall biosynthesis
MNSDHPPSSVPRLVWVYTESPTDSLSAATWLETTRELRQLGWRVTLIAVGPAGQQCIRGVEVLCIPKPQVYLLRQVVFHIRLLSLLVRQWDTIDMILFHQMSAPWLLPLRLVRRLTDRRRPLLVMDTRTVHMVPRSKETWKDRLHRAFYNFMDQLANRWADGRLAITQRMAKSVRIPPERLWGVWPSGVNLNRFAPTQVARRWPLPGEPIHLIHIGSMNYERNLMTLSQAVEQAHAEGMAFTLSLVGDGTERLALERLALRTEGRVRVLGVVPHDQLPGLLVQAHVGVLPFPDEEKFRVSSPTKLFEYMAAGLPILATQIVCHTDVVKGGKYAFWAEQADVPGLLAALRLVWQDRDSLGEMGSQAASAAQAWTWKESAKKLKNALENGIARSGSGTQSTH